MEANYSIFLRILLKKVAVVFFRIVSVVSGNGNIPRPLFRFLMPQAPQKNPWQLWHQKYYLPHVQSRFFLSLHILYRIFQKNRVFLHDRRKIESMTKTYLLFSSRLFNTHFFKKSYFFRYRQKTTPVTKEKTPK